LELPVSQIYKLFLKSRLIRGFKLWHAARGVRCAMCGVRCAMCGVLQKIDGMRLEACGMRQGKNGMRYMACGMRPLFFKTEYRAPHAPRPTPFIYVKLLAFISLVSIDEILLHSSTRDCSDSWSIYTISKAIINCVINSAVDPLAM
jgi:hypothetical protein